MLPKKLIHKAAEVRGELLGNKIADKIVKPKMFEEIIIAPEKKRRNIKRIKESVIKMEHYKISKLLNHSTV